MRAAQRVARGWLRRIARYQQEFLDAVQGRKFRNPSTGNEVQFGSLPSEEQIKIYEAWARGQGQEEEGGGEDDGEAEDEGGGEAEQAMPDRYKRLAFNVDGEGEDFLREVMGGGGHRERLLDTAGLGSIGHLLENVDVEVSRGDEGTEVRVRGYGDHGIEFTRILRYEEVDGAQRPAKIRNEQFMVDPGAPEGIGTRMLTSQVLAAEKEGFRAIETTAAGRAGTSWQGYYVWPRLGFDGEIEEDFLKEMDDDVRREVDELAGGDPPRFMHLMASESGRKWWRDHGRDVDLEFPLGAYEDNLSRELLLEYAREKAKASGKELDEYLSRVATKDKKKGDGASLSKEDERLLELAWVSIRQKLLARLLAQKPTPRRGK